MKLKSLTISGFKSFADKTKIDFFEGITGIVGPNGSGKSNIIEALQWVLGEQSAKNLRGGKMNDVIFAGSQTRSPLNRAEVELVLDNSDRFLAIATDEVAITRRIYRNGDSEYLINHNRVRLRDISDLFIDTGLGKESFSIISQGKVEAIFNSKPLDRRMYIEEVAGVLKYKKEKQQAENKLVDTTAHLERLNDIVIELRRRRDPLEEQASIARDYLEQKRKFDYYKKSHLVLQIQAGMQRSQNIDHELTLCEQAVIKYAGQVEKLSNLLATTKEKQEQLDEQIDQVQHQVQVYATQREYFAGQTQVIDQQAHYTAVRQDELAQQISANRATLVETKEHAQELVQQIIQWQKQLIAAENSKQEIANGVAEQDNVVAELKQQQAQQVKLLQQQAQLQSEKKYLTQEQTDSVQQHTKDRDEQVAVIGQLESLQHEAQLATHKIEELETAIAAGREQLEQLETVYQKQKLRVQNTTDQWQKGNQVLQRAQTHYDTLVNINAKYSGYYQGAREVLRNKNQLAGIIGSVAETIEVSQQYLTAISTALGSQAQNIIVTDEQAAQRGINYLRSKRLGRATFLPRTTVQPYQLSISQKQQIAQMPGLVGIASELVGYPKQDANIIQRLLGTTIIATTMEAATAIAQRLHYSRKIVTLAGDVISTGGSFTGGAYRKENNGVLGQSQEITALSQQIKDMQAKLAVIVQQKTEAQKQCQDVATQVTKVQTDLQELQQDEQEKRGQYAILAAKIVQIQEEVARVRARNATADDKERKIATQLGTIVKKLRQVEQALVVNEQAQKRLEKQITAHQVNKQATQVQKQQLNEKIVALTERIQALKVQQKEVVNQQERLQTVVASDQAALKKIRAQKNVSSQQAQELKQKQIATEENYQQLQQKLKKLQAQRQNWRQKRDENERDYQQASERLNGAKLNRKDIDGQKQRTEEKLDTALQELQAKFSISYEQAARDNQEDNLEEVERQLRMLHRGLAELGTVNVHAIEEFKEVDKRYQFLLEQQDDLLAAKAQLENTMAEMDDEVTTRFADAFAAVQAKFTAIFPQIFGGGRAELILTDPEDMLHTGIDIMAQPPGKKFRQLSLLSGGERALVAITLLFAILQVKPVPFAILDEAEAALDDANIERYSRYLQKLDKDTQFIVITHRKGTMLQANVLYGVTMQESGVSQVVSLALGSLIPKAD